MIRMKYSNQFVNGAVQFCAVAGARDGVTSRKHFTTVQKYVASLAPTLNWKEFMLTNHLGKLPHNLEIVDGSRGTVMKSRSLCQQMCGNGQFSDELI